MEIFLPIVILGILFIGFPWVIFHYITKWKTAATLTDADENLLDELHDLARRLDERMNTIERIIQAENPNWRSVAFDPVDTALEDRSNRIFESGRLEADRLESGRISNRPQRRNR
jgi:phage shock protein B